MLGDISYLPVPKGKRLYVGSHTLFNACWNSTNELRDRVTFHTLFMKPAPEMPLIEKCPGLSGKNYRTEFISSKFKTYMEAKSQEAKLLALHQLVSKIINAKNTC